MTTNALDRVIKRSTSRRQDAEERCELCGAAVPDEHRHILDDERSELMCACRPCALLFERPAASRGHYKLVPERRVRLADISAQELGAPVGLAYFVKRSSGTVTAYYPSPVGATQWEVAPETWAGMEARCPPLLDLAPEVEALLIDSARGADHQWLVPISDCYRLVALVRREWTGMWGGSNVWKQIEAFFAELGRRPGRHSRGVGVTTEGRNDG